MKRLTLSCVLGLFLFVFLLLTSHNSLARDTSQYGLGGIVDTPLPEWIHPSPLMDLLLNLDEICILVYATGCWNVQSEICASLTAFRYGQIV